MAVTVGLDVVLEEPGPLAGKRIGLITNATAINRDWRHIVDLFRQDTRWELRALFAPEHGFRGAATGEVGHARDPVTGLPVYSLYGKTRRPTPEMLEGLDALVFDVQDAGVHFYTYESTMAYAMEEAARHELLFVVLDRPNPIGGHKVEGPVVEEGFTSFAGAYPGIPIRHGLTIGELARYVNEEHHLGARLWVVPMRGWRRTMWYDETGLPIWVMPSPGMPTLHTATVYPGTGLLEGSNLSEGRGTTRPFELVGAPYVRPEEFASYLNARGLEGVVFRPVEFVPQWGKYAGEAVGGVQVHVVDRERFDAVSAGLEILVAAKALYPGQLQTHAYLDELAGNGWIRQGIESGLPVRALRERWEPGLAAFLERRRRSLLYQ
ncbi:MAG: DUF1343 domain-containing protein [Limnochordaceae bacterium]|nr:DUF1343 domain-containing protein [Limnochordaceae bacterium]